MPKETSIAGKTFGRWLALERGADGASKANYIMWYCKCSCGNVGLINKASLIRGDSKSCGCLHKEVMLTVNRIHGHTHRVDGKVKLTPTYRVWQGMKQRCSTDNPRDYVIYKGRGIKVCDRWLIGDGTLSGFECFLSDMGEKPTGLELDRFPNNDGNYEPGNCRWATRVENCSNQRTNVNVTYKGKTQTLAGWSRDLGIPIATLTKRYKSGFFPSGRSLSDVALARTPEQKAAIAAKKAATRDARTSEQIAATSKKISDMSKAMWANKFDRERGELSSKLSESMKEAYCAKGHIIS